MLVNLLKYWEALCRTSLISVASSIGIREEIEKSIQLAVDNTA